MSFTLPQKSIDRLIGVHPALVAVVMAVAATGRVQFVVTEGTRTLARQKELVANGKSKTMRSRHISDSNACKLSCAVDLAIWVDRDADKVVDADELSWKFPDYKALADVVKEVAKQLGTPIEWGGDWESFKDGPHFQLPWKDFP
jgi:peptidoglycan L-alanyl-D-glutamate endopeptidase CwlK